MNIRSDIMPIFEKIINREIPEYIVYEDDLVIAFLDILQSTKGHTLVVHKKKYVDIFDIDEDVLAHLIKVTKKLAIKIKDVFDAKGVNLVNNNGKAAFQSVFHYHMHIIPRYENDNFDISFENNTKNMTDEEYKKRAALIKAAL